MLGDRAMNDAPQGPAGQIQPMEAVVTSKVGEEHAIPKPAEQPRASALKAEGASAPTHEIRAPTRDTVAMPVALRGGRQRRVGLVTGALIVTALGFGAIGGASSSRLLDLQPVWTALQQRFNSSIRTVASGFESVWNETVGSIAAIAGRTAADKLAGQDATSKTPNTPEVSSHKASELDGGVDGRESSQGAARDLTIRVEQVREATERSQREIAAGLVRLGERLDRVEHQLANVSATKTAPSTAQQNTSSARPAVP